MLAYNAPGNAHRNFCTLTLLFQRSFGHLAALICISSFESAALGS